MERGEDWEYEAVRAQWTTIERHRRVTKRLLAAFSLGLVAVVLFMLALTPEACMYGRGSPNACDPVTSGPVFDVLVIAVPGRHGRRRRRIVLRYLWTGGWVARALHAVPGWMSHADTSPGVAMALFLHLGLSVTTRRRPVRG